MLCADSLQYQRQDLSLATSKSTISDCKRGVLTRATIRLSTVLNYTINFNVPGRS